MLTMITAITAFMIGPFIVLGQSMSDSSRRAVDTAPSVYGKHSTGFANVLSCSVEPYLQSGDTAQAIRILEQQRAIVADSAQTASKLFIAIHGTLGELYLQQNRLNEAETVLIPVTRIGNESTWTIEQGNAMINLAQVQALRGNEAAADSLLMTAIEYFIRNSCWTGVCEMGLLLAARIKERLKKYETARQYYGMALNGMISQQRNGDLDSTILALSLETMRRYLTLNVQLNHHSEALEVTGKILKYGERYGVLRPHDTFYYQQLFCKLMLKKFYEQDDVVYDSAAVERNDVDASEFAYYDTVTGLRVDQTKLHYDSLDSPTAREQILMSEVLMDRAMITLDYTRVDSVLTSIFRVSEMTDMLSTDTLVYYLTLRSICRSMLHDPVGAKQYINEARTYLSKVSNESVMLSLARVDRANGEYYFETKEIDSARACFARSIHSYEMLHSKRWNEFGQAYLGLALVQYEQHDLVHAAADFDRAERLGARLSRSASPRAGVQSLAYARSLSSSGEYDKAYAAYKYHVKHLQRLDGRYSQSLVEPLREMLGIVENTSRSNEVPDIEDYIEQIRLGPEN